MNIYDEAKNNIKDIEERLDELDNRVALESIDNLKLFIERAKKVEELLGLYKEYRRLRQLENKTTNQFSALVDTINKIDDLEKELEEL